MVVFPLPVGPVTRIMPWGLAIIASKDFCTSPVQAKRIDGEKNGAAVEEPEDEALPVDRRHGGNPDVDAAVPHPDAYPPVLGKAALGDVHLRHQLESRSYGGLQSLGGRFHFVENPVDAIADHQPALVGLEVYVAGPGLGCPADEEVDEPDHGSLRGEVPEVLLVLFRLGGDHLDLALLHVFDDLSNGGVLGPVQPVDGLENFALFADDGLHLPAADAPNRVHGVAVGRIGHDDADDVALEVEGQEAVVLHELNGIPPALRLSLGVVPPFEKGQPEAFGESSRPLRRALFFLSVKLGSLFDHPFIPVRFSMYPAAIGESIFTFSAFPRQEIGGREIPAAQGPSTPFL